MCPTRIQPKQQPIELDLPAAFSFENGFGRAELLQFGPQLEQARQTFCEASALEAGLHLTQPQRLLAEYHSHRKNSLLGKILALAKQLRETIDHAVILGPPQLTPAAQSLLAACGHPHHNSLSRGQRGGRPRIYFAPALPDNDAWQALLDILPRDKLLHYIDDRWGIVALDGIEPSDSRDSIEANSAGSVPAGHNSNNTESGPQLAGLFSLLWDALQSTTSASDETRLAAVVGPQHSPLMALAEQIGLPRIELEGAVTPINPQANPALPISAFRLSPSAFYHPGVLLAGSVMGIDIVKLLHGAVTMVERFAAAPPGANPPLDFAGLCHLLARRRGIQGYRIASTTSALAGLAQNLQQPRGASDFLLQWIPAVVRHDRLRITMPVRVDNIDCKKRKDRLLTDMAAQQAQAIRETRHAAALPTAVIRLSAVDESSVGQLIQLHAISTSLEHHFPTPNS